MIALANRRELFVDDALLEQYLTDAMEVMHHPIRRELIMTNDAPWEANGWVYYTVLEDHGIFRMYYLSQPMYNAERTKHECPFHHINYAQSLDGVHWTKPELGIFAFQGSKRNNIVMVTHTMDAFHVFYDDHPRCPAEERYKAVYTKPGQQLWCMVSADGVHFQDGWMISDQGRFDSHNTAFFDSNCGLYRCYYRDYHQGVRDIQCMTSPDFHTWSQPVRLRYQECTEDFQMYTNGIKPYFRAPHIYIGLPTRYTERPAWTLNYDQLCGAKHRQWRMSLHPRYGLAVTDGLLMTSRDGYCFRRHGEAFLRPGPESPLRWVYGDCYASYGMLATPTQVRGEDRELSLYAAANCWSDGPVQLFRYALRLDGFISRHGDWKGKRLVTKPFTFQGDRLLVNFATSGAGCMRIVLEDQGGEPLPGYDSGELFGDSTDRSVIFSASLAALQGMPVRMRVELRDSDIYSFKFSESSDCAKGSESS